MASCNAVQRAFDAHGKAQFEEKRSGTWVRRAGAIEQRLNLQKSQYSLRYYLNVELAFPAEGGRGRILGRAERLLTASDAERLEALLDIEGNVMEDERREHELPLMLGRLAPMLDDLTSIEAIVRHERQGTFKNMGINGPARAAIDHQE